MRVCREMIMIGGRIIGFEEGLARKPIRLNLFFFTISFSLIYFVNFLAAKSYVSVRMLNHRSLANFHGK